jgi:putative ABC transport system permease protein
VGAINTLPLSKGPTLAFMIEGRPPLPPDQWPGANYRNVTPDYFRALGIPIVRGRAFGEHDNLAAPQVVLVNQALAQQDFRGEDPVGKRVSFGGSDKNNQPIWLEIVGVVSNVRSIELQEEPLPEIYTASLQDAFSNMSVVIRTSGEPGALAAAVREAAQDVDRGQPVADIRTMENIVSESVTQPRFNVTLLGVFGAIALILSAAGIYGVTSYTVSQRTHEIGIRMALGAKAPDVLQLVMRQGMKPALTGLAIGLAAAIALTRLMKSLLFGVTATDPVTFAALALLLLCVALLACYFPARRATKVDPMVALRCE